MIFDLIVLIIILLFGFLGLKNGFIYSIFRFTGWIIAIVAAIFLESMLVNAIKEYTTFFTSYHAHVEEVCYGFVERYTDGISSSVPGVLGDSLDKLTDDIVLAAAENIAQTSFSVIIFISLVLIIKFVLFLITILFSKKYHSGFVGGMDGIVGCIFGIGQGVAIVLIILALLMPLSFTVGLDFYDWVNKTMSNSLITEMIYTNNPLLNFIDGFVPEEFLPGNWADVDNGTYDEKNWNNLV